MNPLEELRQEIRDIPEIVLEMLRGDPQPEREVFEDMEDIISLEPIGTDIREILELEQPEPIGGVPDEAEFTEDVRDTRDALQSIETELAIDTTALPFLEDASPEFEADAGAPLLPDLVFTPPADSRDRLVEQASEPEGAPSLQQALDPHLEETIQEMADENPFPIPVFGDDGASRDRLVEQASEPEGAPSLQQALDPHLEETIQEMADETTFEIPDMPEREINDIDEPAPAADEGALISILDAVSEIRDMVREGSQGSSYAGGAISPDEPNVMRWNLGPAADFPGDATSPIAMPMNYIPPMVQAPLPTQQQPSPEQPQVQGGATP